MDFDSYNKVKMQYIREVFKLLEDGLKKFRETRFESDVEEYEELQAMLAVMRRLYQVWED
jgi:hypothetical protein